MVEPTHSAASFAEADKARLKRLVREDEEFRRALVADERVFQRLMDDEETFLKVSPALYFEVLLHRALRSWRCPPTQ